MRYVFHFSRILVIFLILTLGLLPPGLVSAQGTTTVSVSAPSQVNSGEQFTVNILVDPGTAIAGAQFNLTFDPALVDVNSVAAGNLLSQNGASTYFSPGVIDNVAGTLRGVAGAITTPGQTVSTAGTFATITLTAGTGGGTCPLTLSGVVVGDINGQSLPVSLVNGQVVINQSSSGGGGGGSSIPPEDKTAPEFHDIIVSETTASDVYISWTTDEESTSQVEYWASPSNFSPLDETLVTHHVVHLTNLTSGTTYHYRAMSIDKANNLAVSDEYTFVTLTAPAAFAVSELDITPTEVDIGEEVTISVLVANSGDTAGSYDVTLSVDGRTEDTKHIADLAAGASVKVTFTTTRNAAGTFVVDVNGITGSFIVKGVPAVEEVPNPGLEIGLFSVTPNYDTETGKLVFARVTYQVNNLYDSTADAELILKVSLGGELFEEVYLLSSSQMGPDGTSGSRDYIPLQGWRKGTYTFRAGLYVDGRFVENSAEERLEVMSEAAATVVSWAVLGMIIGGTLIVILFIVLIVLDRQRNILRFRSHAH